MAFGSVASLLDFQCRSSWINKASPEWLRMIMMIHVWGSAQSNDPWLFLFNVFFYRWYWWLFNLAPVHTSQNWGDDWTTRWYIYNYTYGSFPVIKIMAMMEFPSLESLVLLGCLSLNSAQNHLQSPDLVKNWYVPQIPGNRSNNFEHLICRHPSRGTLQAGLIKTALEHHRRSNLFMPVS